MARYILIDSNSGNIWGDTALLGNWHQECTPLDAARMVDEDAGERGRRYEELSRNPQTTQTGYDVYRADINGSEAVRVIDRGDDEELIEAVQRDCEYVGFVACYEAQD